MTRRHNPNALRPAEIALVVLCLLVGGTVAVLNAPLIGDWIVGTLGTLGDVVHTIVTFINPF